MQTKNVNIPIWYIHVRCWRYQEVRNVLRFNNGVLAATFGSKYVFKAAARLQWQIDLSPPDSSFLN